MRARGIAGWARAAALLAALLPAPAARAADQDADGVDDSVDNCIDLANATQTDTDGDGCGNACDADYDQSGSVGAPDWNEFRFCALTLGTPPCCPWADHEGNGCGGDGGDLGVFRQLLQRRVPGPSAVSNDPVACP